tara:strand:+ start:2974 stop:3684 length:711 start_codon:yes stop_codon:yes gene_type:complete
MSLKKKYLRLFESRFLLNFNLLFHKIFKEKDIGSLNLDFGDKPSREFITQSIIDKKNFKSYLEIGCRDDDLFSKINCRKKIGVDPVSGGTLRMTSDNFFIQNSEKFDCIFIDGLHKYHQVKKDIVNSLSSLNPDGIVLLHDCLPDDIFKQAIPRCKKHWNGDVWKSIVEFRTNPEVDVYTCYADQGIGVIFNRKNRNLLKIDKKDFSNLKFKDYFYNYKSWMNVISFDKLIKIVDL